MKISTKIFKMREELAEKFGLVLIQVILNLEYYEKCYRQLIGGKSLPFEFLVDRIIFTPNSNETDKEIQCIFQKEENIPYWKDSRSFEEIMEDIKG